ncbi:lysophospholipid acyltransferase family protein [Tessaracoccus flavus]|jgi:1-acyl-sn-glycerol-3-phosphate acyltransferase|uniref:1-acyl-sn-glycerol-3-phosphate acyltransferase n=1 Tax=Tessaracoccus flavus TaxID=1610493 RepID=A0A1Q2CD42_9ACTN|nr:lysophospholipid acyltransferase family protein [Tessaracoccus flavus]AQP44043.1 1-acyl-sn-glycerol-3-phosphate acyltransferase [Tessaracoccus flavus]SDY33023.1 1-acyl-sn-glycerol-3-phosphate acyltransferase [Tessaracoccus flavus]
MWYRLFKFAIFRPLVKYGYGARLIGAENFPRQGGAILASNHIGALDSLVIPAMVPRPLRFPAKAELFSGDGGLGAKIIAWFLKRIDMVPIDRTGGRASADALGAISDTLAEGNVVAIYPEGTRSPDGRLYKGKTGMARIALQNRVPVIPVGVVGTKSRKGPLGIPWVTRPLVIIGEPLDFSAYAGTPGNTRVLRWVTDETLAAIQQLTGQEYADVYAARVKQGDLAERGSDDFVIPRPGGGEPPQPAVENVA